MMDALPPRRHSGAFPSHETLPFAEAPKPVGIHARLGARASLPVVDEQFMFCHGLRVFLIPGLLPPLGKHAPSEEVSCSGRPGLLSRFAAPPDVDAS